MKDTIKFSAENKNSFLNPMSEAMRVDRKLMAQTSLRHTLVGELMCGLVCTAKMGDSRERIIQLMNDADTNELPLVDEEGVAVGIVTHGEVVRAVAYGGGWMQSIGDSDRLAKSFVRGIYTDSVLELALSLMDKYLVSRLVITDRKGRPQGILSEAEVQTWLAAKERTSLL